MELSIDNISENPVGMTGRIPKREYLETFEYKKSRHVHIIGIVSIWAMFIIAAVVLIIRAAHFILPECACWLNAEKLQNIDKFLFSGAFGGILARYAKYIFTTQSSA